jgi:DNA-binding IclR family transcriptional regulator
MIVLGRVAIGARADVADLAEWLGLPPDVVERLCTDLEAAGLLTRGRRH